MIRFIYNLLWPLGLFFFLPRYLVKMFRRGGYRENFGQRLGFYDASVRARLAAQVSTWLHAVSVGEVAIALKLAEQLRRLQPEIACVLTVTTTTGFSFARKNAPSWMEVMYMPLDFWPIMHRAFAVIRPQRIVLVEAEVWPNLVAHAHAQRIPVALVNARLSPRSGRRFRRFQAFVAPIFRRLDLVCVPEPDDVERWAVLGVERSRIRPVGNIKSDPESPGMDETVPQNILRDFGIDHERPIILGGSTHRGEEEILGTVFRELRSKFPDLFLIVAPRHAERAREVQRALQGLGLNVALGSQASAPRRPIDCLVLDSTGELRSWYPAATVVFVGKSLVAHGGQNPIEPVVAGVPVIFGPNMENFASLAQQLVVGKGAIQVQDTATLDSALENLLRDSEARRRLVRNAEEVLSAHRGAAARTAQFVAALSSSA